MSNQETSFVTIGQRILANPLRWAYHSFFIEWNVMLFYIQHINIYKYFSDLIIWHFVTYE